MYDRYNAGLVDDGLCFFGFGKAVGDGDVAISFSVDTRHLTAEELAVDGGVFPLIYSNVVMNHLMKDGVFDEGFGKVNTDIYTEDKILIAVTSKETLFAAGKGDLAEEAFGVGELDGDRWQRPAEIACVVLVKAGLDIRNRWFQFKISNLRFKN